MGSPAAVKLKLHRRNVELDGERFAVLSLRPTTAARFATTEFHETCHILSDVDGAELLGRLSWAMAFQSRKHTILLVDLPLIVADPFGDSPAAPIIIVNSDLGTPTATSIEMLVTKLPFGDDSEGSVRLTTAGFDRALADVDKYWLQERAEDPEFAKHLNARWVERVGGAIVLAAPGAVLRQWGVRVADLAGHGPLAADWKPADEQKWTGEVKVLAHALA